MQVKDLILLFDAGSLKKATICKDIMSDKYILITDKHTLQAQRGGNRQFSTIDAAVETANKIGFKTVTVKID